MPELPEVETIVQELRPVLTGKTIQDIEISWPRSITGSQEVFKTTLTGRTVKKIFRRGKYICFTLDDKRLLTIHLRMSGKLLFAPCEKDNKHLRVKFVFPGDCALYFCDMRKFGRMKLWQPEEPLLPQLGPEPLDAETAWSVLKETKSRRAIKNLLLDQQVLAGIGNIYADEALFAAGIHPQTPAATVSKTKLKRLSKTLPEILKAAIINKGTTFSDYRPPKTASGSNQFYLKVYGRENQPCPECDTPVRRLKINGRSSHFCPKCQRR